MHSVAAPKKQTMSMHAFILLQTKLLYVLLICEPFILAGLQQTMGLLSFMLFSLLMLPCAVVVCLAQSFLFGHINSFFLKNKIILCSFLGHKNVPIFKFRCFPMHANKKQISIGERMHWIIFFVGF